MKVDIEPILPKRVPDNKNLTLHHDPVFRWTPVRVSSGPLIKEYLEKLYQTVVLSLRDHPRTFAFRVDLRIPYWMDSESFPELIERFQQSLRAKVNYDRLQAKSRSKTGYAHHSRVRFVWAREIGKEDKPHFHVLILVNRDAYFRIGRLDSEERNLGDLVQQAWASALAVPLDAIYGLVQFPKETDAYHLMCLDPDDPEFRRLMFWESYLCKYQTKQYGDRRRSFGYSRR